MVWLALSCGPGAPTAEEAEAFLEEAEARFLKSEVEAERAAWVLATYITHDSELVAARASERFIATTVELAQAAARFKDVELPEAGARPYYCFSKVRA